MSKLQKCVKMIIQHQCIYYKAGTIALDLGKADKALKYFNKIKEELSKFI